ncbi:MAG: hypothetical protein U1C74_09165 [Phenylobacterium sp.]|nr:hypothetical protein [Phenylobacterium sp.]
MLPLREIRHLQVDLIGMDFIRQLARKVADTLMEDHGAFTPSQMRACAAEVSARWAAYVRRNRIQSPVIHDVAWFLWTEYRLPMPDEDVAAVLGPTAYRVELRMDRAFPRLAAFLLDGGVLPVEQP